MPDNQTPNRGYQLPHKDNDIEYDVARIIAAITGIDLDIAAAIVATAGKADSVHGHVIADTTGLQGALNAKQDAADKGEANGYAALDATGKVPVAQLPAAIFGALSYQGTWNATTNTPTIPAASAANKGHYYKVATAGTTTVGGFNDWAVGDWLVSNGTVWDKVDNTELVSSVAGLVGAISAAALKTALAIALADVSGLVTALGGKSDTSHVHAAAVAAGASGFMTGADKTKLNGIAAGATNSPAPDYGAGNAALAFGAVGTYAWLIPQGLGAVALPGGTTVAGSMLISAGVMNSSPLTISSSGAVMSGTWRSMGASARGAASTGTVASLFLRIS